MASCTDVLNTADTHVARSSNRLVAAFSPLHVVAAVLRVVRPRVQLVQLVLPAWLAVVPTLHAEQVALLVLDGINPGLQQTQSLVPVVLHD
jgi:hypothetical protein